jgi:hypothetical protein
MTSSDDNRSPWPLNPPVASSNREIVSGLNALVSPNGRYGSWISTPSMTVSSDPARRREPPAGC